MAQEPVLSILFTVSLYIGHSYSLEKYEQSFGDNEDSELGFRDLITKYGYSSEDHQVTTEDGYLLTVYRIPRGARCKGRVYRRPLVLMHGLMDSSDTFVIPGPGVGLAYILADACHDVWLPNHRGNTYSRDHLTLNADVDKSFWNFTFDQHGLFDLKAIIDYVLEETLTDTLNFVGHSQGATDFLVLASSHPEYNDKIRVAILLAPVAWLTHTDSPVLKILARATRETRTNLNLTGQREIFKKDDSSLLNNLMSHVCTLIPDSICASFLFAFTGAVPSNFETRTLAAVVSHFPSSTSTNSLFHWMQASRTDKFQRFDYGVYRNLKAYGAATPPAYNVSKVTAPVVVIAAREDWLASRYDVDILLSMLPNVVGYYRIPLATWSHVDFVWGKFIPDQLAPYLLESLKQFGQTFLNDII